MKAIEPMISEKLETVHISLTLDTRKREERLPVAIRINQNRKTIYYRTGLKCSVPTEWEKLLKATGRGANKTNALYIEKENQLAIYDRVKSTILELQRRGEFNLDKLKVALTGRSAETFTGTWLSVIESKKPGTAESYTSAYKSFTSYFGESVDFSRVSVDLIRRWSEKMKANGKTNTTIGVYMRACRVIVNVCLRKGQIHQSQYPFGKSFEGKFVIPKGRTRRESYLDVSTINKLLGFKAPKNWSRPMTEVRLQAIDLWMISYLGNGLNLADMALLTYDSHYFQSGGNELKFIRKKTMDTTDEDIEIIIPIIPELRRLLDRHAAKPVMDGLVFPFILNGNTDEIKVRKLVAQWNSNIQDRLEPVCKELGIPCKLSMTYARHSFNTNLMLAGVPELYVSQSMGHSVRNVTEGYTALFPPEMRIEYNNRLLKDFRRNN
ncbi:MAG TPA: phage integrase SAM-like domain-containing protein [Bacteroidales bacterium]|nr:phage integrase SAM-like domain-containing protein [Bacteroidales bacterium]